MVDYVTLRRAAIVAGLALVAAVASSCAVINRLDNAPPPRSLGPLSLKWVPDPDAPGQAWVEAGGVDVAGVAIHSLLYRDADARYRLLSVRARPASAPQTRPDESTLPMVGEYEPVAENVLRFRPGFPLEPGMQYVATLDPSQIPFAAKERRESGILTATYTPPPRPASPQALVSVVYPTADTLPENLLKFYIHFSAPMSRGDVYRHIHLLEGASGAEVELPFLELDEELWDPAMTRLTLFIDPGRIKRGVRPLEEIGPALEAGKRYTLVIDRGLIDATGRELAEEFRKPFTVAAPDRDAPDPASWKVTPPRAATRDPVTIDFPDPMDHALAERLIRVTANGTMLPGQISLVEQERRWLFTPATPWPAGRYEIVAQPTIEDLAGNNIGKPFEVETDAAAQPQAELQPVRMPFDVR